MASREEVERDAERFLRYRLGRRAAERARLVSYAPFVQHLHDHVICASVTGNDFTVEIGTWLLPRSARVCAVLRLQATTADNNAALPPVSVSAQPAAATGSAELRTFASTAAGKVEEELGKRLPRIRSFVEALENVVSCWLLACPCRAITVSEIPSIYLDETRAYVKRQFRQRGRDLLRVLFARLRLLRWAAASPQRTSVCFPAPAVFVPGRALIPKCPSSAEPQTSYCVDKDSEEWSSTAGRSGAGEVDFERLAAAGDELDVWLGSLLDCAGLESTVEKGLPLLGRDVSFLLLWLVDHNERFPLEVREFGEQDEGLQRTAWDVVLQRARASGEQAAHGDGVAPLRGFHGTAAPNLHCIIHCGLRSLSGTRFEGAGAIHGEGVYLCESDAVAVGFATPFQDAADRDARAPALARGMIRCTFSSKGSNRPVRRIVADQRAASSVEAAYFVAEDEEDVHFDKLFLSWSSSEGRSRALRVLHPRRAARRRGSAPARAQSSFTVWKLAAVYIVLMVIVSVYQDARARAMFARVLSRALPQLFG